MAKKDLSLCFIDYLNKDGGNKKELVYKIADILNLEAESVYRRLAGTVKFSVYEMGILAQAMNISIDSLLNQDMDKTTIFLRMGPDLKNADINDLIKHLEEFVVYFQTKKDQDVNVGIIFSIFPLEFFMFYPYLAKYMYFMWGHYHIGTKEFNNFSEWEIPKRLINVQNKCIDYFKYFKKVLYLWDFSLIPRLVNEINYYLFIGVLTTEDVRFIKKDILNLLENFEEFLKGEGTHFPTYDELDFECYVTNLSVNITSYYVICGDSYLSAIDSSFLKSANHYDSHTTMNLYNWINSLKKISSLISGGCEMERAIFFRRQHRQLENMGNIQYYF